MTSRYPQAPQGPIWMIEGEHPDVDRMMHGGSITMSSAGDAAEE